MLLPQLAKSFVEGLLLQDKEPSGVCNTQEEKEACYLETGKFVEKSGTTEFKTVCNFELH